MLHVLLQHFPLWWLAPPPCPVGSMSLDSRVAYSSPMNPVPLPPPQFGGATKGKRLNGQARRLSSPHLEVLCRTSTGDNKAPLCCELLMKGMFRGVLFCPLHRGKSGEAGKGEASAASQFAGCQSSPMTLKANPVTLTLYLSSVRAIPQPSGPQGPSNLRTLRPIGPVNPKNLSPCPLSEANTTCRH